MNISKHTCTNEWPQAPPAEYKQMLGRKSLLADMHQNEEGPLAPKATEGSKLGVKIMFHA